jgi:imidazoleglycerol phosphate synthase cyclase subunit
MLAKRIIPCLDIKDSRTVKGVNFVDLVDAGDPVELARYYSENGADELVFLDITATKEDRKTFAKLADEISKNINIPFTVGGGIKTVEDVGILLKSGADTDKKLLLSDSNSLQAAIKTMLARLGKKWPRSRSTKIEIIQGTLTFDFSLKRNC